MKKLLFFFLLAMSFSLTSMAANNKNETNKQANKNINSTCLEGTSSCGTQMVACCASCSTSDLLSALWIADGIFCGKVDQP